MATVPLLSLTEAGQALPAALTATGVDDTIPDNDGFVLIEIHNPTGGALDVSFIAARTFAGVQFPARTITVGAGATVWTRPLAPAIFNTTTGDVTVQADAGLEIRGVRF